MEFYFKVPNLLLTTRFCSTLALVVLLPSTCGLCQTVNSAAINFELSNQFGQTYTYEFPNQKKTILVFADRHGSKQTRQWTEKVRSDFKADIQIVGIACMGWVPFFIRDIVKSDFKEKPPILLDWSNNVAESYGYKEDECLIVYIDPSGIIRYRAHGVYQDDLYNQLKRMLSEK